MSLWNKILVVFIVVAALVFFHAAARTVKTYRYWAGKAHDFEVAIKEKKKANLLLVEADNDKIKADKIGIRKLRSDLGRNVALRGRIWDQCDKQAVDAPVGAPVHVTLSTQRAVPNGPGAFSLNQVVYAFEVGDDEHPGNYLGEFHLIPPLADDKIELLSNSLLSTRESELISKSNLPWVLYEIMPVDRHETFADVPKERIDHLFPEESKKYWYDGKKPEANDAELKDHIDVATGKYERPLRDYREIFHDCYRDRTLFNDTLQSVTMDSDFLKYCVADVLKQKDFAEREIAELKATLNTRTAESSAVKTHLARMDNLVAVNHQAVEDAIAKNKSNAALIARLQKEAAEMIDRRIRSMAQYGAGTPAVPRTN